MVVLQTPIPGQPGEVRMVLSVISDHSERGYTRLLWSLSHLIIQIFQNLSIIHYLNHFEVSRTWLSSSSEIKKVKMFAKRRNFTKKGGNFNNQILLRYGDSGRVERIHVSTRSQGIGQDKVFYI